MWLVMLLAGFVMWLRGRGGAKVVSDYKAFLNSNDIRISHEFTRGPRKSANEAV